MSSPPSASTTGKLAAQPTSSTMTASFDNDGSRFQNWKAQVEMVLDMCGLWSVVGGADKTAP